MSQPLNNLDIIILIILGLSALIALSRGLIKDCLLYQSDAADE